jgi:hypothetical protein
MKLLESVGPRPRQVRGLRKVLPSGFNERTHHENLKFRPHDLRLAPLVPMASIGISYALHLNRCIGIDLSRSVYGFGLRGLVTTDSVGTWPADRVIAIFSSPFDKQFATH